MAGGRLQSSRRPLFDQARGDVPRTVWIRRAIEQRLAKDKS